MDLAVRNEELTIRVGGVVLLVLLLLGVYVVAFDGCRDRSGFAVTVYFDHLGALHEGADVQVAGQVIGRVTAISLVPAHRVGPGHLLYPDGGVAVIVRIDGERSYMAPVNSEFFISAKGILGERFIEVGVPPGNGPRERPLQPGDEVRGIDPPRLDQVLARSYRNMQVSREFVEAVGPEAREFLAAVRDLTAALAEIGEPGGGGEPGRAPWSDLVAGLEALRVSWDAAELTPEVLERLTEQTGALVERLDAELVALRSRLDVLSRELASLSERLPGSDRFAHLAEALAGARASLARVDRVLGQVRELLAMVARGQGTIGALLFDPEFPEDAKDLGRMIKRHPWRLVGRPDRRP